MTEPRARAGSPPEAEASSTRDRILEAALRTVREAGFAETTARAIARTGGFNQALIFYHFGSLDRLLDEAYAQVSARQIERYRAAAAEVSSLSDLVRIARRLHAEDMESGVVTVVTQLMAAASEPEERAVLLERFEGWIGLVQDALVRAAGDTPIGDVAPPREAAYAIASMFLGVELLSRLDPSRSEAEAVFDMLEGIARLIEEVGLPLLRGWTVTPPAP
jgi:AcrR family transcriptional regulator